MITPNEIQKKDFTKGVRGYREDEVNAFLDLITIDMDRLIQENNLLKEKIRLLNEDIERYKGAEDSIFETLETAKALMADISASAEKRAEIVLKNAELEAERIQKDARESVALLHEEAAHLTSRWTQFKTKYKNLLENEIERFDGLSADFLIDNEMDDFQALTEIKREDITSESDPIFGGTIVRNDYTTTKTIKASKHKIGE